MKAKKVQQDARAVAAVALSVAILSFSAVLLASAYAQRDPDQEQPAPVVEKPASPAPSPAPEPTQQNRNGPESEKTEALPERVLHNFSATAYVLRGKTASGVHVKRGIVAADPNVLPIGSIIRIHAGEHSGIYTVLDTGHKVRGRRLDIWFPNHKEAILFGHRRVRVEVIRYGWDPKSTEVSDLLPTGPATTTGLKAKN
jgi:3D (Asp-Asp-Asp) domain-containing protein